MDLLREHKFQISFSRKGNCYDNACIEAFHSVLKRECIYRREHKSIAELKFTLFKYIEGFYNRNRMHGTLGNLSPEEYENVYEQELEKAA